MLHIGVGRGIEGGIMKTVNTLRVIVFTCLISTVAGCRLEVIVPTGGDVETPLHTRDCSEGSTCLHEINDATFNESFTAIPNQGYIFSRWQRGEDFLCDDSTDPTCVVSNTALAGNAGFEEWIAGSFQTWYIMPVFTYVGGVPLDGFGTIAGDCGVIAPAELDSSSAYQFRNTIDFGTDPYDSSDYDSLSPGAQTILDAAGGASSGLSQAFAFEMLRRCPGAQLLKTQDEIVYVDVAGKAADLLVEIAGRKVGMTSTRAIGFPPQDPYTQAQAQALLESKLDDVNQSNANVAEVDSWSKQILHVFAYTAAHADALELAYTGIDETLKADTILLITVSEGADEPLY